MPADRDPFDGVRLDEGFVKAARFIEPSAVERRSGGDAKRGAPCQVSPVHRGLPGFFFRLVSPPKPAQRRRRAARLVTAVALTVGMVSLAVVLLRQNVGRGQPTAQPTAVLAGPTVEVTASATVVTPGDRTGAATAAASGERLSALGVVIPATVTPRLAAGVCLTWTSVDAGTTAAGLAVVDCFAQHRAEVTGVVDLAERFPTWPGRGAMDGVVENTCPAVLADYLNTDPRGLLPRPGGAYPGQSDWNSSSQVLACLVVDRDSRSWTGSVRAVDRVT